MSVRCGIDLGTTYSAISWYDDYNRRVENISLESSDGESIIPSVVFYEESGRVVVGPTAINKEKTAPERTIRAIKRSMGDLLDSGEPYRTPPIDGNSYTPQEVSSEILKVLAEDAAIYLGEEIVDVVITVPAHFGDRERHATKEAAQLAGLNVLELIPEPHAAALAFAVENVKNVEDSNVIVYDLGGGTFDVTLISTERVERPDGITGLRIKTLAKEGDRQLGGIDWDRKLADRLIENLLEQNPDMADPRDDEVLMVEIMQAVERAKRDLSRSDEVTVTIDRQPVDITRAEFEDETEYLLDTAESLLTIVLDKAHDDHGLLTEKQIQELVQAGQAREDLEAKKVHLLLCGGSTRMPMVRECVERIMGESPLHHRNPELLVTIGAAYRAYLIGDQPDPGEPGLDEDGQIRPDSSQTGLAEPKTIDTRAGGITVFDDTIPDIGKAIGVLVYDPDQTGAFTVARNHVIIPDGTEFGVQTEATFNTTEDGMTEIPLIFYEGDDSDPQNCRWLAEIIVAGLPPDRPAGRPVRIKLWYDKNGIVTGQAIDLETHTEVEVIIER